MYLLPIHPTVNKFAFYCIPHTDGFIFNERALTLSTLRLLCLVLGSSSYIKTDLNLYILHFDLNKHCMCNYIDVKLWDFNIMTRFKLQIMC